MTSEKRAWRPAFHSAFAARSLEAKINRECLVPLSGCNARQHDVDLLRRANYLERPLNPARNPDRCRRSPTGAFVQQSVARLPEGLRFLLLENDESTSFFRSFLCGMNV
jgi:hypothetical protein